MHNYSNTNCSANSIRTNSSLEAERYSVMDLCSQAQMSDDVDNILNRMSKLRDFAREQQAKRVQPQRQQTSFCF